MKSRIVRWYAMISFVFIGFVFFVGVTYNNTEKNSYQWKNIELS